MQFYKTKQFVACRNLQVISMRFAVFLCYSVRLFIRNSVQFCSIRTPLHPPPLIKWQQWHEDELKLCQKKDNPKYNSEILTPTWPWPSQYAKWLLLKFRRETIYTPTPHPKGIWLITASCRGRSRNIPNRGQDEGAPNFKILRLFQTIIFTLLNLLLRFSVLCSKIYYRQNAGLKKNSSYFGKIPDNQEFYCFPPFFVMQLLIFKNKKFGIVR